MMRDWKLSRVLAAFTLAACALAAGACEGGGPHVAGAGAPGPTVVFHMTGLVLIVPPKKAGDPTSILLPPAPGHRAVLGFGFAGDVSGLCLMDPGFGKLAFKERICYVDLTQWSLQEFGEGGNATPQLKLPSSTPNVTQLSGGQHIPRPDLSAAQITFRSGWVGPTTCSLADWTLTPVDASGNDQTPVTRSLANVVDWEIVNPRVRKLTFVKRDGSSKTVDLAGPDASNRIELIIANLPGSDLPDLLPGSSGGLSSTIDAADFANYYTILRKPSDLRNPPAKRPRPMNGKPTAIRACPVNVTLAKKGVPAGGKGVGTYGCMPATGP